MRASATVSFSFRFSRNKFGTQGGTRTRKTQFLRLVAMPIRLPEHEFAVPPEGLEPSRLGETQVLSLLCMPFHHGGLTMSGSVENRTRYNLLIRETRVTTPS